ncbi:MAG: thiamine phosphate synthase [Phascolarctobacterium faecium]
MPLTWAPIITSRAYLATSCKQGLPGRGLDFLSAVCAATSLPVYAIGGITPANIGQIKKQARRAV